MVEKPTKAQLSKWEKLLAGQGLGMSVGYNSRWLSYGNKGFDAPTHHDYTDNTKKVDGRAIGNKKAGQFKRSLETLKKMSLARKGKPQPVGAGTKGLTFSEDTKAKMRASQKARRQAEAVPNTCGHLDQPYKALGMCNACYCRKRYRERHTK